MTSDDDWVRALVRRVVEETLGEEKVIRETEAWESRRYRRQRIERAVFITVGVILGLVLVASAVMLGVQLTQENAIRAQCAERGMVAVETAGDGYWCMEGERP